MLLVHHFLRLACVLGQFGKLVRQFGFGCEYGCSVECAVPDVDLVFEPGGLAIDDIFLLFCFRSKRGGRGGEEIERERERHTTSPPPSLHFPNTSPMTARDALTSEMARRPWSYSFCASTITSTLSFALGLEGGTPRMLEMSVIVG